MVSGTYFVREITFAGLNAQGNSLNTAYSLWGTMTFSVDSSGDGSYTFTGQELVSTATGGAAAFTSSGSYSVSANGMIVLTDPIFTSDPDLGEVGTLGPGAFVVTQPGVNPTLMIGIPVGGTTLNGPWNVGYYDFHAATWTSIRSGYFSFDSDGSGNLGTLSATGGGTDLGNTQQSVQIPSVTYSFSGQNGTINFGGAAASQFISGAQSFEVSQDGTLMLGGSTGDYDMLVGVQAAPVPGTSSPFNGVYFLGGYSTDQTMPGLTLHKAFNGSMNAVASMGLGIEHQQYLFAGASSYQNSTTEITFPAGSSTAFQAGDGYEYAVAPSGAAYVAVPATNGHYGIMLGMHAPASVTNPGSGVWLNPLGVVNSASWAPVTNPVAPNELVTLAAGSNLAPSAMSAPIPTSASPLPTTLNGVQVYVNGAPAPLLYVSPTQINMLAPSSWYPGAGWYYLTFQVYNNGVYSNAVRVLAANSAPGVFDFTGSATGPGIVRHHSDGSLVTGDNPARPGEVVDIYATGLGITSYQSSYPDGSPGGYSPLIFAWHVYINGVECDPTVGSDYAGLAWSGPGPYFPGLYQITVTVPDGTGQGDLPLEISLNEGYTVETTVAIGATPAVIPHVRTPR